MKRLHLPKLGKLTMAVSAGEVAQMIFRHRRHLANPERRADAAQDLAWDAGGWAVEAGAGSAAAVMATTAVETAAAGGSVVAGAAGVAAAAPFVAATAAGIAVGVVVKRVRRRLRPAHNSNSSSDDLHRRDPERAEAS